MQKKILGYERFEKGPLRGARKLDGYERKIKRRGGAVSNPRS
jgi:hypothetical protein